MKEYHHQSFPTIDFHTHFPISPVTSFISGSGDLPSFKTFITALDKAHVTKAVLLCGPKNGSMKQENQTLRNRIEAYSHRFILMAWLNPKFDTADDLETLVSDYEYKGLKLHPVLNQFKLNESEVKPLIEKAIELEIPILIHSGWGPEGKVSDIGNLAERFPDGTFICCHMKEEFNLNDRFSHIELAIHHPNVFLECSYIPHPRRLADAVDVLGDERILFGSDYPWGARNIKWEKSKVIASPISEKAKKNILQENAKELLKL